MLFPNWLILTINHFMCKSFIDSSKGASESEIHAAMELLGESGSTPNPMKVANLAAAAMDLGVGRALTPGTKAKKRASTKVTNAADHPKTPNPISRTNSAATAVTLLNMSNDRRITDSLNPSCNINVTHNSVATTATGEEVFSSQHGFMITSNETCMLDDATTESPSSLSAYGYGYATGPGKSTIRGGISIETLPTHEESLQAGKYPKPSPAASGKRKMAEIAAAEMLAGVGDTTQRQLVVNGVITGVSGKGRSATPPPPPLPPHDDECNSMKTPGAHDVAVVSNRALNLNGTRMGHSESFQLSDAEILSDHRNTTCKRRSSSPLTPWDAQLAALVRYVCDHF